MSKIQSPPLLDSTGKEIVEQLGVLNTSTIQEIASVKTDLTTIDKKIVFYLTQVRDALNGGDIPEAVAILDQAILDFNTLA